MIRRRLSDSPKIRGGASGHDTTDCPQVRGCPLPFVFSGGPRILYKVHIQGGPKKLRQIFPAITLVNTDRF